MTRQVNGPSRYDLWRNAQGLIAETGGPRADHASVLGITGTLYFQQIYLMAGDLISTSWVGVGVAPVALTLARVGIWDSVTGALLASCADQSASWNTVGLKSQAFTVPLNVTTSGVFFIGLIAAAGTMPSLCSGTAAPIAARANFVAGIGGTPLVFGSTVGLADLPNPLVIAAGTAPTTWWIGVS